MPGLRRPLVVILVLALLGALAAVPVSAATATTAIEGRVTGPDGAPLYGVIVDGDGNCHGSWVRTDIDGRYRITGLLASDTCIVHFSSGEHEYLEEWWPGVHELAGATELSSTGATITDIDAQLDVGASFSGTITGPTGAPLAGAGIELLPAAPGFDDCCWDEVSSAADGSWTIGGVAPGDYIVSFGTHGAFGLADELWSDAPRSAAATAISVDVAEVVPPLDAQLTVGGALEGTVTGPDGQPLGNTYVELEVVDPRPEAFRERYTITDWMGRYHIDGLAPGPWHVHFIKTGMTGASVAIPAGIVEGGTHTVDVELADRPSVAGTVRDSAGAPVGLATVEVLSLGGDVVRSTTTNLVGTYFSYLSATGTYRLRVTSGLGRGHWPTWFGDAWHQDAATLVVVDGAETGIDVVLPLCDAPAAVSDVAFESPFCTDVDWLLGEGIASGFADGTFGPGALVSRQAIASFLYAMAGSPAGPFPDPGFTDVRADHPFVDEIAWLADAGLASGYADGTFRPGATVSRQAVAAMLHAFAGSPPVDPPYGGYYQDIEADHPFGQQIKWLRFEGITIGYPDRTFRPAAPITRQALAAYLFRAGSTALIPVP